MDFLDSDSSEKAVNALDHLREGASYVRVLGCYPVKSNLVGKVRRDYGGGLKVNTVLNLFY